MKAEKEIHKIKNELVLMKVFFSTYEDVRSRKGGENLIKKNIKQCMNGVVKIERLIKRIEKRDREEQKRSNNR